MKTCVPFFSRRSMAAVAFRKSIYFFGGVGSGGTDSILDVSNDLWRFDTANLEWKQIPYSEPWPSARRCVGWIVYGGDLLLWGGSGICRTPKGDIRYTFLNDLWRFILSQERWELLRDTDDHLKTPFEGNKNYLYPFPRYTPVFQSMKQDLFLFGGYTEDRLGKRKLNDTWVCRNENWYQLSSKELQGYSKGAQWPGLRYGSMATSDERNIYVCGGSSDNSDHIDLWRFDMLANDWELLSQGSETSDIPHPRYCAAFSIYENKLFLFGGRARQNPKQNFSDLWFFDLITKKWQKVHDNRESHRYDAEAEFPAYHAKSASAAVEEYWYILGGEGQHGHVSDFWRYCFADNRWQMLQPTRSDDPEFW